MVELNVTPKRLEFYTMSSLYPCGMVVWYHLKYFHFNYFLLYPSSELLQLE